MSEITNSDVDKNDAPVFVVGLGASAGGLEAIEAFFENMPAKSGLSFVLIQHLSPDFRSLMDEILARYTDMDIYRVENEMPIYRNSIYLIPPKKTMIVSSGKLLLKDQETSKGLNLPINEFFRALAQDYRKRAIGIILSGTGSDGSRGIRDIHDAGGFVIAQDDESSGFDGMPRSAVKTGMVDLVLSPSAMPDAILQYIKSPEKRAEGISLLPVLSIEQPELHDIFELLRLRYGIEFKYYKPSTIDRRIERRISITHCENLADYVNFLTQTPAELDNLYHDLLIGVTRFFRDPPAFELLKKEVLPKIINRKLDAEDEIRIWMPGCATGEEAYSVAISINELIEELNMNIEVKIFATDIHQTSLNKAALGVFNDNIEDDISIKLLKKYFTRKADKYVITREIRKMVIFAPQNVMSDPPFTNLDLLVCRNMLIYLEANVQKKVYSLFHFAMNANAFLFLGPSESLSGIEDEFDTISTQWKIYKKRRDVRLPDSRPLSVSRPAITRVPVTQAKFRRQTAGQLETTITWAYEAMLQDFVQTGFLIDENSELLHTFGDAKNFLRTREGRTNNNLLSSVDAQFSSALSAALHRVNSENKTVNYKDIRIDTQEGKVRINISVRLLRNKRSNKVFYFIGIDDIDAITAPKVDPITVEVGSHAIQQIQDLESELQYAKEHLQATNEELEASNEELQASNEELLATNEELQSTNEELQSTNEELQSTNEELHSVNEELNNVNVLHQNKIDQLTQLNNDVENLLTSTEIGTMFLDKTLHIRKYTPAITSIFNIMERDLGRSFKDIPNNIIAEKEELLGYIEQVIESDSRIDRELECRGDVWALMRILPYHDEDASIQGVVITFIDITLIKRTATDLEKLVSKLQSRNQELNDFSYVASHDLQAPLRQINGFIDLINKKTEVKFDKETKEYFAYVEKAATKMSMLVDGLLQYSRVNTRGGTKELTNFETLLDNVLEYASEDISNKKVLVKRNTMPKLRVDPKQIRVVLTNIIDNAVRYNENKKPVIDISVDHIEDEWVFHICDNGKSIKQDDADKIFMLFRRLQDDEIHTGTGLGLAISKRIIERHGGRIWLGDNATETGNNFYFALPISDRFNLSDDAHIY